MRRWTVDTNVPIVANGRHDGDRPLAPACREASIRFLMQILRAKDRIVLDDEGEIEREYRRYLNPKGQPGVGDRFFQRVLSDCDRVRLPKRKDGEYADLPQPLIDAGFDPSDRKFAALAKREGIPLVNATDSDWINAKSLLDDSGIRVEFVCGCDPASWFAR